MRSCDTAGACSAAAQYAAAAHALHDLGMLRKVPHDSSDFGGQEVVQPRMMEQVVSCRDDIAQQYLMQCVIQGFPDECHLRTLPALLAALPELQAGVRVHLILASLLDRLARCA